MSLLLRPRGARSFLPASLSVEQEQRPIETRESLGLPRGSTDRELSYFLPDILCFARIYSIYWRTVRRLSLPIYPTPTYLFQRARAHGRAFDLRLLSKPSFGRQRTPYLARVRNAGERVGQRTITRTPMHFFLASYALFTKQVVCSGAEAN